MAGPGLVMITRDVQVGWSGSPETQLEGKALSAVVHVAGRSNHGWSKIETRNMISIVVGAKDADGVKTR